MLADKAGFGKSAQFVRAADLICAQRITIICPPILRRNAADEYAKWSYWRFPVFVIRTGKDVVPPRDVPGVVIVSQKLAAENKVIKAALRKRGADVLILDEAHGYKDPKSVRSRALFLKSDGIAGTAENVWFVTATPAPTGANDWFTFLKVAGVWTDTYNRFVEAFCETSQAPADVKDVGAWYRHALSCGTWRASFDEFATAFYSRVDDGTYYPKSVGRLQSLHRDKIIGVKNPEGLKSLCAPYVLARDKVDTNRPPLTLDHVHLEGSAPKFEGVEPELLEAILEAVEKGDWRLLDGPAVASVRRAIGVAKAEAIADRVLVELDGGINKGLLFLQHTTVIDAVAARLGKLAEVVDGRTSAKRREELTAEKGLFQTTDSPRVLICQRQALKEGVTLTAADRVWIGEPPWLPDDIVQLVARAWRRGQTRPVWASLLWLANSFDDRVAAILARREAELAKISMSATR